VGVKVLTWGEFADAAVDLADTAQQLLYRTGSGEALLATVRQDEPPRIHPIAIEIADRGLYAFILPSPKLTDLEVDGRYALHAYPDAQEPRELLIRGHVRPVTGERREALADGWSFGVGTAPAFEFLVAYVLIGERDSRDDWPPRYRSWSAPT
jgi:hypothetical protein